MKEDEINMTYIKRMVFVNAEYRDNVDLRPFNQIIKNCVREILPTATVYVCKYYYEIQTKKEITNTESRLIGRMLGKTQLSKFTIEHFYNGGFTGRSGKIFKEKK